jgi:hypothetical protein
MRKRALRMPLTGSTEANPAKPRSETKSYTFYQNQTDTDKRRI